MFLTISMLLNLVIYLTIRFVECMNPSYSTEVYTIVCRYFWKNSTKCHCVVFFVYKSKCFCPSDRVSFKHRHRIVDLINEMLHVCQKCKHSVCIRSLFNIVNWENLRCLHRITPFQDKQKNCYRYLELPWLPWSYWLIERWIYYKIIEQTYLVKRLKLLSHTTFFTWKYPDVWPRLSTLKQSMIVSTAL